MHTPTASTAATEQPAAGPAQRAAAAARRLVIDAPTRMFHWLFALSFLGAYLTADGERWRALHVTLGYTLAGLLVFRLLYGLIGPRQARLSLLLRKLSATRAWLRTLLQALRAGTPLRGHLRQGQNLAMALAVAALLLLAVPLTLSGYGTYNEWGQALGGDWLGEVHEFFGNTFLAVVLLHLALITGLSLLRQRNQALPMLTGRIDGPGPHLVQRDRRGLAAALLIAVLAFGAWQWQQSPQGLMPGPAHAGADGEGDDDD